MWKEKNNKLNRNLEFNDFIEAWGFLCKVAMISEKVKHHPEINCVYNKISLSLFSHDKGKITSKDAAANWALPYLPSETKSIVIAAKDAYLGLEAIDLAAYPKERAKLLSYVRSSVTAKLPGNHTCTK